MRIRLILASSIVLFVLAGGGLVAQVAEPTPHQDPTGHTGALKGNVQTGCGYNAHNGNGVRSVSDLEVPGALGDYGLDFTRHWNSLPPGDEPTMPAAMPYSDFGTSGWSHSWAWNAGFEGEYPKEIPGCDCTDNIWVSSITITFPDGRVSKYKISRLGVGQNGVPADPRFGPPYSAAEANWQPPGAGVYDRLEAMASDGSNFWLHRQDGGSIHFVGQWPPDMSAGYARWSYRATEIYDPHGFKTTLTYNGWQLTQVMQEGGRFLTITWGYTINGSVAPVIRRVETGGSAGAQAVDYTYAITGTALTLKSAANSTRLTTTFTSDGPPATYTYTNSLLMQADDPRFAGAMTRIRYKYTLDRCTQAEHPVSDPPDAHFDYVYAQPEAIAEEQSTANNQSGLPIIVSRFAIHCWDGTRTEWNGLGGFRNFYYGDSSTWSGAGSRGNELAQVTDFTHTGTGVASGRQSHLNGHPYQHWDGRGIITQFAHGDSSGLPKEVRHVGADGSFRTYNRTNPGSSLPRDPVRIHNPNSHWLFSQTDERGFTTTYKRDPRRRITQIDYPDGSYETFVYNDSNNEVTSHRLPSGAIETKTYYSAGHASQHLLWKEWNSVDGGEANAKIYTYDSLGRVATVSEPRNRFAVPAKDFSTRLTYNGRHQITKVEYAGMLTGTINPSVSYGYDGYGNCTSITNELGEQSLYTYDDYRRCTSYTEPLNAPDWKGTAGVSVPSRTWHWTYDRVGPDNASISAMAHTSKEWRLQIEPPYDAAGNRRATVRHYDYNDRLVFEYDSAIQAPNGAWTYPDDAAMHSYTYDANGQKSTYTDPLVRVTSYTYDNRNRLFQTIEPLNRTTSMLYDVTNNKTKVTFPDLKTQQWLDYDAFGQPGRFIDERNNTTNLIYWSWGPMKKLYQVTTHRDKDAGGTEDQPTTFSNDGMGRPLKTSFPDGSYEESKYEFGQLKTWQTREEQLKTIVYDERGREKSHSWNDTTPAVTRTWDKASRLTSISNLHSTIDYTYDDAGQVITEGNAITGASAGHRETTYWRYPNGVAAHITYPNGWRGRRDYTSRGQLETTGADNASGVWTYKLGQYTYLTDGKVQTETGLNEVATGYLYDGRGQVRVTHTLRVSTTPTQRYSYRTYNRDTRDRISAWSKSNSPAYNVLENGRGDRYSYDAEGQLTAASYEALTPAGTPTDPDRTESFIYDALGNRKGSNVVAGRGAVTFYRRDNGLNQYSSWTPLIIYYDDNYPGWGWPGNGVMMAEGWITASYNALNQPIAIWSPAYSGTSNYMWFGFDPLGRCVKRWVGPSSTATTATYLYYDGWNLIQEGTGAAAAERIYLHGHQVDRIVCHYNYAAAQWRYHHYDARGHCILLTDPSGNLVEQYEYDAFGKPYFYNGSGTPLPNGSTAGNRFLFTGREWLSDLKLYDYRHRLYQPELGRFLQPDPKQFDAGDYNLYRYCHNDPVNQTDWDGLASLFSDQTNGMTIFDPNPEQPGSLSFYPSLSRVLPTSLPGAGDPYRSGDIYVVSGPYKNQPDTYGPNSILQTDDTERGRWIHGGGKGVPHPQAPRQGWYPTHGCTRLQNQDMKDLTKRIREFQRAHPGVKIPYHRDKPPDFKKLLTRIPKEREA